MTAEHDRQMLQFWVNEERLFAWLRIRLLPALDWSEARTLCAAASTRLRALQQSGVL